MKYQGFTQILVVAAALLFGSLVSDGWGRPINHPPMISGTPPTSVMAGQPYSFQPTASDPDGNRLTFNIVNRPAWASFNSKTGLLSGTPTVANTGTTSGVTIQVSDRQSTVALSPFNLTVTASRQATLTWIAPTTREDGTPLSASEIAGYRVYNGPDATVASLVADVHDPSATSYSATGLNPGVNYFAVTAYDTGTLESAKSAVLSITIQ